MSKYDIIVHTVELFFNLSVLLHLLCVNMSTLIKASLPIALFYITELPNDTEQHLPLKPPLPCDSRLPCLFWSASVWSYTRQLCLSATLRIISNLPRPAPPPLSQNILVSRWHENFPPHTVTTVWSVNILPMSRSTVQTDQTEIYAAQLHTK